MAIDKPDLTRVWANGAPGGNVVDPDVTTPGKFAAGWQAEVPPFEHFNFIQKLQTQGLAHINEQGIPVWDTDTVYPINALVKGSDGTVYKALSEQSGNDPISSPNFWSVWDADALQEQINQRAIYVDSLAELNSISPSEDGQVAIVSEDTYRVFEYDQSSDSWSEKFEQVTDNPAATELTSNGCWSWFGGPRATRYVDTGDRTYFGTISSDNEFIVGSYDHSTGEIKTTVIGSSVGGQDDHDAPAILALSDGRIAAFYSDHNQDPIKLRISSVTEDITTFDAEITVSGAGSHTYPFVAQLSSESGRIYCFFIDRNNNRDMYYVFSDDVGLTWSASTQLIDGRVEFAPGGIYYQAFASADRIDFCFTGAEDGADAPHLDVSHAYFSAGSLFSADDSNLGAFPVAYDNLPRVYDSLAAGNHNAWVWDIVKRDNLIEIVYAVFPSLRKHEYRYARYENGVWSDILLSDAGSYITDPETPISREGYYSGGVGLDRGSEGVIYACIGSRNGTQIVRMERTIDGWSSTPYTNSIEQNIRPVCPENSASDFPLLWVRGDYGHYSRWDTRIMAGLPADRYASEPLRNGATRLQLSGDVPNVANNTVIPLDVVSYDSIEEADLPNNGIRVKSTGLYLISASLEVTADPNSVTIGLSIGKNGVEVAQGALFLKEANQGAVSVYSDVILLNRDDLITLISRWASPIGIEGGVTTSLTVVSLR